MLLGLLAVLVAFLLQALALLLQAVDLGLQGGLGGGELLFVFGAAGGELAGERLDGALAVGEALPAANRPERGMAETGG